MTRDPVCGRFVEGPAGRGKSTYQGCDYVFCSDNCKRQFDAHPDRYAPQSQAPPQQQRGGSGSV